MFKSKFSSSDDRFDSQFDGYEVIKGEDGFSPLVEISDIENGHRVQIIDINGGKYFDVLNGRNGRDGVDGRDGKDGKDGYTPIKGVDYFDGKDGKDGKDGAPGRDGKDAEISPTDTLQVAKIITRDLNGQTETTLSPILLSMYESSCVQRATLTPIELTLDAGSGDDKPEIQLISPMTDSKATLNSELLHLSMRDEEQHGVTAILDRFHLQIGDTVSYADLGTTHLDINGGSVEEVEINLSGARQDHVHASKITNYGMWLYEDINDDSFPRASFTPNEITMEFGPTQLRLNPYELYLDGGSSDQPYINLVGWGEGHTMKTTITNGYSCFWGELEVVDKEGDSSLITPTFVSACKGYFGDDAEVFVDTDGIVISQADENTAQLTVIDPEEGVQSFITPYEIYSNAATFGIDDNIFLDSGGILISNNSGDGVALRLYDGNINATSCLSPYELSIGPNDNILLHVTQDERAYINCNGSIRAWTNSDYGTTIDPDYISIQGKETLLSITPQDISIGLNDEIMLYVPNLNIPHNGQTYIRCDGYIQAFDYQDGEGTSLIARLDSLDSSLGDIDTALEAILAKHASVLGGGA